MNQLENAMVTNLFFIFPGRQIRAGKNLNHQFQEPSRKSEKDCHEVWVSENHINHQIFFMTKINPMIYHYFQSLMILFSVFLQDLIFERYSPLFEFHLILFVWGIPDQKGPFRDCIYAISLRVPTLPIGKPGTVQLPL